MNSLQQAQVVIREFLASSREPLLMEPGSDPVRISGDNCVLEFRGGRLTLQAWDDRQNIVRRVSAITSARQGRLELSVARFGKREGTLVLVDQGSSRNHDAGRKASRWIYRETFRRSLGRQFPEWSIVELSTDADLEHSLSPAYTRALLRRGSAGWAAVGAAAACGHTDGALTFGLIWLDYLRKRERRLTIEGLSLLLPAGRERTTGLRLRYMNPKAARFELWVQSADTHEHRVDLADYGNLDTSLAACSRHDGRSEETLRYIEQIEAESGEIERIEKNDGSLSLRVRGLEFARTHDGRLLFGLETRHAAKPSNLVEVAALAAELGKMRSPEASNRENPLYSRCSEGWLESQVRRHLREIDATLESTPVYGQVPAFTAGDRDVIDLLAVDASGRLAVLELKASEDVHLPLQALDYWMRVKWHAERGEFSQRGYFPGVELRKEPPRLILVAPALDFHPSNELVLRYFSSDIQVDRIGVGLEWRRQLKVMFRHR